MDNPIRRPEEILAYRPLRQILGGKPKPLWTVRPSDSALAALQLMADKDIGFLVVLDGDAMVGVLSERDCARRLVLAGKPAQTTPVVELMVRNVVSVDPAQTFADCLRLMHQHRIRHLPVVDESGSLAGIVSIGDVVKSRLTELEHENKALAEYISGR